ncbi:GAF domain-containing sensor histidine kinase [Leptodesmis sp.]|uniref:GAF domain-containing sensor histidine kinase n=1 Tax=Leptodesmis sp. TaxID=3100501 RepID=UPI0040534666
MQKTQKAPSTLSSDLIYSQTPPTTEATFLYPVPHTTGAMSVRETPTLSIQSQVDLTGLVKQLNQVTVAIPEPDLAIPRVAALLGEAFQVDGCLVVFSTPTQVGVRTAWWIAETGRSILSSPFIPAFTQTNWVNTARLNDGTPTVIPDVQALSSNSAARCCVQELAELWPSDATSTHSFPYRSVLEVQVQLPGMPLGRISLLRSRPYSWPACQIEQLEAVAQQVLTLLSHLNLQQKLKQQAAYQGVIKQLAIAIRNSSNLSDVLQLAVNGVATALGVSHGLLLRLKYWDPLFRSKADEQIPKAQVTVTCEWFKEGDSYPSSSFPGSMAETSDQVFWLSECTLCQYAFLHSPKSTVINNAQQILGHADPPARTVFQVGERDTLLVAPLESQGTVLGFLVLRDDHPRSWQPEEIELVELMSAQVSTAIIQTETLRQVQSLVEKRTTELKQSLAVQAKLYERTRNQLEQLRQLNQLKDEFLDTVSHELRTPLTSMALAIRMLRQTGTKGDRGARYLDILEQQCAQETNLINDLLALRELGSKQTTLQLEELNLVDLVTEVTASFESSWAGKGLTLELEIPHYPLSLWSDRESLTRILVELLTNATRYSEPQTCIRLAISTLWEDAGNQIVLTLTNQGAAIPPEELPYIFDRFRRCHSAVQNAVPGTGLGLALVKSLTQHLNGTISASSVPTEQSSAWITCFTLVLPQAVGSSI